MPNSIEPVKSEQRFQLSICIPTYNRPTQLSRMLKTLVPQLNCNVELIFRDDSENSSTEDVVRQTLSRSKINWRYIRGKKNGVDKAALSLILAATGEYLWWLSDDDELYPNAVKTVLDTISSQRAAALWANFTFGEGKKRAVAGISHLLKEPDQILDNVGTNVGLISTQIVRRDLAIHAINFANKHVHGFSFASTAVFLKVAAEPDGCFFVSGPIVHCNPTDLEEIRGITNTEHGIKNDGFLVYGQYFRNLIIDLPGEYSQGAKTRLVKRNFQALWRGMLVGWVGGWDTPDKKRIKLVKLYWMFPGCWLAILIFALPRRLAQAMYKLYRVFFSHRKLIFFDRFM